MKVNRDNYEVWLINHLEGILDDQEEKDLARFLDENQDVRAEFDLLKNSDPIEPESIQAIDFAFLKKPSKPEINEELEEKLIASLEGDLTPSEEVELQKVVQTYPDIHHEYKLFQLARLTSDSVVLMPGKDKLKKGQARMIRIDFRRIAVAASLITVMGVSIWMVQDRNSESSVAWMSDKGMNQPVYGNDSIGKSISGEALANNHRQSKSGSDKPVLSFPVKSSDSGKNESESTPEKRIEILEMVGRKVEFAQVEPALQSAGPASFNLLNSTHSLTNTQTAVANNTPKFLNPGQWIFGRLKQQIPSNTLAQADTLIAGAPENKETVAINLLAKTTGINFCQKLDSAGQKTGFSIVSRYFAYERVSHP